MLHGRSRNYLPHRRAHADYHPKPTKPRSASIPGTTAWHNEVVMCDVYKQKHVQCHIEQTDR